MILLLQDIGPTLLLDELWLFKMGLTLIAAISSNNVIGNNGKVPWHLPEDLKRFRKLTLGHPVIMGRKTYESLPENVRPLPGRKNIVLSESLDAQKRIHVAQTPNEALGFTNSKDTYIIGGRRVYELFLPYAETLEITRVHREFPGDVFFPEIHWGEWNLSNESHRIFAPQNLHYSFLTYVRK